MKYVSLLFTKFGTKKSTKTIDKGTVDKTDGNTIKKNKGINVCYYEQKS